MVAAGTRKRGRILLVILLVGLALVGGLVVKVALFATARPTISTDYTAEYNECVRPADLDPNDNAAALYREAFARLPNASRDIWLTGSLWEYEPNSIVRRTVESWVVSCEEAIRSLHQATEKRCLWVPLSKVDFFDPTGMEGLSLISFRTAAICLRFKAQSLTIQGDVAGALNCAATVGRMAHHLATGGRIQINVGQALNGLAVGTAFDVLSRTPVDSNLLDKIQTQSEAALLTVKPPNFAGDEILLQDAIQRYFTDDGKGNGHVIPRLLYDRYLEVKSPRNELAANAIYLKHLYIAWTHPTRRQTLQSLKNLIERANELLPQSPWELHVKGTNHERELTQLAQDNDFLRSVAADTTLARTIQLFHRIRISNEALVTTMGLLRFHKDKSVWPGSLEELAAAGYIRKVPIDPYSGKPLVYKQGGDSFILYSCGLDFDDDGGLRSKWGNSPEGGDQVFWPVEEHKK